MLFIHSKINNQRNPKTNRNANVSIDLFSFTLEKPVSGISCMEAASSEIVKKYISFYANDDTLSLNG